MYKIFDVNPQKNRTVLSHDEIINMVDNDYVVIGSHTNSHRDMTKLTIEEAHLEFSHSKDILQDQYGKEINFFSFPGGFYSQNLLNLSKKSGYKGTFITENKIIKKFDPLRLGRISITGTDSYSSFKNKLSGIFGEIYKQNKCS